MRGMRVAGPELVVAIVFAGCTSESRRPTAATGSSSSTTTVPSSITMGPPGTTRHVAVGGLAIEVPSRWPSISRPDQPCPDDLTAPVVIVGTLGEVRNCVALRSPAGPEVTFVSGGPPDPPVPTGVPEARTVNGVAALVATVNWLTDGSEAEFLALFPDWGVSLRVGVKGPPSAAMAVGTELLDTISVTGDTAPVGPPAGTSFVGHWRVHGARLDIGERTAVYTASCGPSCRYTKTMTLARSLDGRRLHATTSRVTYTDPTTGRPVPDPYRHTGDPSGVGDTSYFEYAAPHLLKQTFVDTGDVDDFSNPYWCGEGLADVLHYHCGA
jgi:hypothetical protein